MNIVGPFNTGVAAGGAGVATANADSTIPLTGFVIGVYVKYNDSPPAGTTDITVKTKGTSPAAPSLTFLAIANAATDGWFYPRVPMHVASTGAVIADQYDWPAIDDFVNVAIAQANNGDSIDVWLMLSE